MVVVYMQDSCALARKCSRSMPEKLLHMIVRVVYSALRLTDDKGAVLKFIQNRLQFRRPTSRASIDNALNCSLNRQHGRPLIQRTQSLTQSRVRREIRGAELSLRSRTYIRLSIHRR